jgi:pyrroline-5-carboxylate reductase
MKNTPSISFIGCGKVGMTIGKLIYDSQSAKILDVYNRNEAHSKEAINFIGSGTLCKKLNLLMQADIYFLGTPDDQIEKTCLEILQAHSPKIKSIFVHFSGALSSDALTLAEEN